MVLGHFSIDQNLMELTEHLTVLLPIACYETTINQNIQGHIPLHWHDELQFVYMNKGKAIFHINGEGVELLEGNGLFINSGLLHMAEEKTKAASYICMNVAPSFVLSQELFSTFVYPYVQASNLPYVNIDGNKEWGKIILESILKINRLLKEKQPFFEIDISTQLAKAWKSFMMHGIPPAFNKTEASKNEKMKRMLDWIHHHYEEKVSLEDIASAGQLSRSECCRYFKRILKRSPFSYLEHYRIQKSLLLLQEEDANITEVGYRVGFNSTSYFIQKFRKEIQMTPLAYKKHKQKS
ncbi:AraC family transcriptional regulator [Niallia taxi]|uniref:AraC family transcriptional regulator n=1 Tax=Niallia taxi TaxID=2499688 RepID=UPI002E24D59E|nr:AraC family transcriptional regulator [Niallia taxi]